MHQTGLRTRFLLPTDWLVICGIICAMDSDLKAGGIFLATKLYNIIPRARTDISAESVGEHIIVDFSGSRGPTRLSQNAAIILSLCNGQTTISSILAHLSDLFQIEQEQIREDLVGSLSHLRGQRLITLCGAAYPETETPSFYQPNTYHSNKSNIITEILQARGMREAEEDEIAEISMWLDSRRPLRIAKYQAYEVYQTRSFAAKSTLCEQILAAGHSDIIPETYTSLEAFLNRQGKDGELWFYKLDRSTVGRYVYCYRSDAELEQQARHFNHQGLVIQKGITDPVLIDGRKTVFRVYVVLIGSDRVYLHEEALAIVYAARFDADSLDRNVQIHASHPEYFSSDDLPVYLDALTLLIERVRNAFNAVDDRLDAACDPYRYQLFGLDIIFSESDGPLIIEINTWPDTSERKHSVNPATHRAIKRRVFSDMFNLVLDQEPGRFIDIS